jgi:hypothetical protein
MTARRVLVPDPEIERVLALARKHNLAVAGLDVGRDYVRTVPPVEGGDSVGQYIGPAHSPQKAQGR